MNMGTGVKFSNYCTAGNVSRHQSWWHFWKSATLVTALSCCADPAGWFINHTCWFSKTQIRLCKRQSHQHLIGCSNSTSDNECVLQRCILWTHESHRTEIIWVRDVICNSKYASAWVFLGDFVFTSLDYRATLNSTTSVLAWDSRITKHDQCDHVVLKP